FGVDLAIGPAGQGAAELDVPRRSYLGQSVRKQIAKGRFGQRGRRFHERIKTVLRADIVERYDGSVADVRMLSEAGGNPRRVVGEPHPAAFLIDKAENTACDPVVDPLARHEPQRCERALA